MNSAKTFRKRKNFPQVFAPLPPPPLTENHPAQKPLAEMGVPPPLNGKNPLSSFWQPPLYAK